MNEQQRAVVQQALEALEDAVLDYSMGKGAVARHVEAITALRQLLEQPAPVQEPVKFAEVWDSYAKKYVAEPVNPATPLYTTPPAQPAAWDYDALHGAWLFIGADLAGLKWEDFEAKLREKNGGKV